MLELVFTIIIAIIISYCFVVSKNLIPRILHQEQSIIAVTVTFCGLIFSILLGFSYQNFWNRYDELNNCILREAGNLQILYRTVKDFPGTEGISNAIKEYLLAVINIEWELLKVGKNSDKVEKLYCDITTEINKYVKNNEKSLLSQELLFRNISHERMRRTYYTPDKTFTIIIILAGVFATVGFWFLRCHSDNVQFIIDFIFICVIALGIYILLSIQSPFTGGIFQITSIAYQDVLNEFNS